MILELCENEFNERSLPTRERGLKLYIAPLIIAGIYVAPYAGAWIEIDNYDIKPYCTVSRSLRGSVD